MTQIKTQLAGIDVYVNEMNLNALDSVDSELKSSILATAVSTAKVCDADSDVRQELLSVAMDKCIQASILNPQYRNFTKTPQGISAMVKALCKKTTGEKLTDDDVKAIVNNEEAVALFRTACKSGGSDPTLAAKTEPEPAPLNGPPS